MEACETLIQETATKHAPWYVVPGDHKWFARIVIAAAIVEALHVLTWPSRTSMSARQRSGKK